MVRRVAFTPSLWKVLSKQWHLHSKTFPAVSRRMQQGRNRSRESSWGITGSAEWRWREVAQCCHIWEVGLSGYREEETGQIEEDIKLGTSATKWMGGHVTAWVADRWGQTRAIHLATKVPQSGIISGQPTENLSSRKCKHKAILWQRKTQGSYKKKEKVQDHCLSSPRIWNGRVLVILKECLLKLIC